MHCSQQLTTLLLIDIASNLFFYIELLHLLLLCFFQVGSFTTKKTPAERSYVSALCRILVLLHFRVSEQGAIKLMRKLLNRVAENVSTEKDLVKELKQMAERLKSVDKQPEEELLEDQAKLILGKFLLFLGNS